MATRKAKKRIIKITRALYNKLMKAVRTRRNSELPRVDMLGMDSEGVVTTSIRMNSYNIGCYDMASIDSWVMNEAMVAMIRKKLTPCGIARVSSYPGINLGYSDHRGSSTYQLRNYAPNSIILTAYPSGMVIETFVGRKIKETPYTIERR